MSIKLIKWPARLSFAVFITTLLLLVNNINAQTITEGFETSNWTVGTTNTVGEIPATLNQFPGNPNGSWTVNSFVILNTSFSTTNATTTSTTATASSNANTGNHGAYVNSTSSSLIITPIFTGGIATVTLAVYPTSATTGFFIAAATTSTSVGVVTATTSSIPPALTSSLSSVSSGIKGVWTGSVYSVGGIGGDNILTSGVWQTITFTANVPSTASAMLKFQRDNAGGVVIDNINISQPVPPSVALASASPAIGTGSLPQGTNNNEIYDFNLTVTGSTASLTSVSFTTAGTYVAADITNFHLYYNSTADNFTGAVAEPPALVNSTGPGSYTITLTSALNLPVGGPYYFYISADIAANPTSTVGDYLTVSAITTANLGFSGTTLSGTASAGLQQTITTYTAPVAYYNVSNSDVSQLSNWGTNTNGTGTHPPAFSTANATYYLINGTTNTLGSNTSISGTTDSLFIGDSTGVINPSAATLTMAAQLTIGANAAAEVTTKGILTVNGYLLNSGSFLNRGTMTVTGAGSTYEHAVNGSSIPTATWGANSTCLVSGSTSLGPGNGNQAFYNLTWNCTGQTGNYNLAIANTTIGGNLTVTSTGTGRFNLTNSTVTPNTITISGNLNINGAASFTSCGSSTPTGTTITMNVTGNIITAAGSTLDLENGAGATSTWNLSGNLTNAGTIKGGNNTPSLHFSKGSGTQSLTNTGSFSTIAAPGGLFVDNGSTLDLGANLINGGINFTLSSGGTLETTLATGVNGNLTTTGTKTLNAAANYIFDGASAQVTGALITAANNIKVSNTAGVSLSGNTTAASLTLTSGKLIIGANTLTVSGAVTGSGTITGSTSSNLTLGGATGTLNFTNNPDVLQNLTLNTGATATIGSNMLDISDAGVLTVNSGATLTTGGNLTIVSDIGGTGSVANSAGTVSGNVTVQRYIPANANREWRLLSVPTQTTQTIAASWQQNTIITNTTAGNGFDGPPQIAPSMLVYTPGNPGSWNSVSATTDPIATTSGYIIYIRGDRTVLPGPSTTGTTPTTLSTSGPLYQGTQSAINVASGNFGLIGNIYASAIDFTQLTTTGGIDTKYYVWDPKFPNLLPTSLGGYIVFSSVTSPAYEPVPTGGGGYSGSYTSGVTNTAIQSGQAFFVHASSAGTVQLKESSKISGSQDVFRPASPANISGQLTTNLYKLDSTGLNLQDGNVEVFNSTYSDSIDGYDALKLSNLQENFGIQRDGSTLVIEARQPLAATDSIYFNMWNMNQTQYQLQFTPLNLGSTGLTGYLQDSYLNTVTPIDLTNGATVNFTVDANAGSSASNRFLLVFNTSTPVSVTFDGIQADQKNTEVAVNWQVAGQTGIKQYEVERSADGVNFNVVGIVAAGSTSSYNFIDATPVIGNNFYRVMSVGVAGDIKYSSIVKVALSSLQPGIAIYPNPVTDGGVGLQFTNMPQGNYNARLLSITGQELYRNTINHIAGSSIETLSLPNELAKGIYKLEVISPDKSSYSQKLILN